MKKTIKLAMFFLLSFLLATSACNPKVTKSIVNFYTPIDYKQDILVINLNEELPLNTEVIGKIKIGDSGFTTNCDYDLVIEMAKAEARKAGGNAIKITEHKPPTAFGSSCHRIQADVLYVSEIESYRLIEQEEGNILGNTDYAVINVYRYGGPGTFVSYDLFIGNQLICRVKNNFKMSIKVKTFGMNSLWAKTEVKNEVPITVEAGKQYYVRCGLKMGAFVGRPNLEIVNYKTGKAEFESFKAKNQ